MYRYLLFLFNLFLLPLLAEQSERNLQAPVSIASTAGVVSSIINQSVSAISGDFVDCEVDLVIPGAEPLIIQRSYTSSDNSIGFIHVGWQLSTPQDLCLCNEDDSDCQILCGDASGSLLSYKKIKKAPKYKGKSVELWPEVTKGMTNVGLGEISGHTNLKNRFLVWGKVKKKKEHQDTFEVFDGRGAHRFFQKEFYKKEFRKTYYNMQWEKKHNGNQSLFTYSKKHHTLESITTTNLDGIHYGSVAISGLDQEPTKDNPSRAYFRASDGREVEYKFTHFKGHWSIKTKNYLTSVSRPNAPKVHYEYAGKCATPGKMISKKMVGDSRYIQNEYYFEGTNAVLDEKIKLRENDRRIDRVKRQFAPLGTGPEPILAYSYIYHVHKHGEGETDAYNALGYRTTYCYDKDQRLISRDAYLGEKKNATLYSSDRYVWCTRDEDEGNLRAHLFLDGAKKAIRAKTYRYDEYGNLIHERLYGNLTGKANNRLELDKEGLPIKESCENYAIARTFTNDGSNLLLHESEYNGKQTVYQYYPNSQLISAKFELNQGSIVKRHYYSYDRFGNLDRHIQDNGSTFAEVIPDATGTQRLVRAIAPRTTAPAMGLPAAMGEYYYNFETANYDQLKYSKFSYDAFGRVIAEDVYDANHALQYTLTKIYDKYDNITAETDPLGQVISRTFDKHKNLTFYQGVNPYTHTVNKYDFSNRLLNSQENHPCGVFVTSHTYDYLGNRLTTTDKFGHTTQYAYNTFGAVTQVIGPPTPNEINVLVCPVTQNEYDECGNVVKTVDPLGRVTLKTYQTHGKPTSITHPDGSVEVFEYNRDGSLAKTIARNGLVTVFTRDCFGNELVKQEFGSDGTPFGTTISEYNGFNITSRIDPAGHITYFQYDYAGRLAEETKADQKKTYAYDNLGRRYKTCEWFGPGETDFTAKVMVFDLLDRITEERVEDGYGNILSKVNNTYDALGNKTQVCCEVNGELAITYTEYNTLSLPIRMIDAAQNLTYFTYDFQFQNDFQQRVLQTKKTDPLGNITVTTMDVAGRVAKIEKQNSFGRTTSKQTLHYDLVGNLIQTHDTVIAQGETDKSIITHRQYDAMNKLVLLVEALNEPEEKRTHHYYNKAGQKEMIEKPDGTHLHHQYDGKGRLAHLISSDGTIHYRYTYDIESHLITVVDEVHKTITDRTYDVNSRLVTEKLGNDLTLHFSYDRQGRAQNITLPDHSGILLQYDALYLRQVQRLDPSGEVRYFHSYQEYDLSGNLLQSQLVGQAGQLETRFDCLKRPTSHKSNAWQTQATYDACSNLLSLHTDDPLGNYQAQYTYDDLYQVNSESGVKEHTYENDSLFNHVQKDKVRQPHNALNHLLNTAEAKYAYDKNGNMVSQTKEDSTIHYAFDALDRLIAVETDEKTIKYQYDNFNRRLKKTIHESNRTEEYSYLYQGENEIGAYQGQTLVELRILGQGKGAEIGAAVALELYGNTYVPIHDMNGNVSCLVSLSSSEVVEYYRYSAFGEEMIYNRQGESCSESQVHNPWRYASKRVDPETQLIYFGRRYYAPDIGRWIAPDPLGFDAGPNLYAYVSNSPLTHFDLYGLIGISNTSRFGGMLAMGLGDPLKFIGREVIPIPGIQDMLCFPGHILNGESPSTYESPSKGRSSFRHLGRPHLYDRMRFLSINGILNNEQGAYERACKFSSYLNNTNVYYTHVETHGTARDISSVCLHKMGITSHDINVAYQSLKRCIYEVGGVGSGGVVVVDAHSKGGSVLDRALRLLQPEERQMIHAYTFGSAKIIGPRAAGSVRNYISTRDSVPALADPIGYSKALFSNSEHVQFLPSKGTPFFDHASDNEVYSKRLKEIAEHYMGY